MAANIGDLLLPKPFTIYTYKIMKYVANNYYKLYTKFQNNWTIAIRVIIAL